MRINIVIVDDDVSAAEKAGRVMSRAMREQMGRTPWRMSVHCRTTGNLIGRDDSYAEYTP